MDRDEWVGRKVLEGGEGIDREEEVEEEKETEDVGGAAGAR